MRVLALDLASVTGWAWGDDRSAPTFGTWTTRGMAEANRAVSYAGIYSAVQFVVRENKIQHVALEAPGAGRNSSHTQMSLTMLAGAAMAGAINGGARVLPLVYPQTWRAQVLGVKRPPKRKAGERSEFWKMAALRYCHMHKWNVTDHNAAEALCIWQWAHGQTSLLDRIKG